MYQQQLVYGGTELQDELCLEECSIPPGAQLKLLIAMRGGPIHAQRGVCVCGVCERERECMVCVFMSCAVCVCVVCVRERECMVSVFMRCAVCVCACWLEWA